ncbi:hypothetical protein ACXAUS_004103 [Clostridium sporogenes]
MVLYFEDEKGNVYSVDLCPTVRKLKKGTVPEVPVQEQSQVENLAKEIYSFRSKTSHNTL